MVPRNALLAMVGALSLAACAAEPLPPEEKGSQHSSISINADLGNRIADKAVARFGNDYQSNYSCLGETENTIAQVMGECLQRSVGAAQFRDWAISNPGALGSCGWEIRSYNSVGAIPRGGVAMWRAGQCGYDGTYGHIEIAIGGGRAISDFNNVLRTDCGLPTVMIPVRGGAPGNDDGAGGGGGGGGSDSTAATEGRSGAIGGGSCGMQGNVMVCGNQAVDVREHPWINSDSPVVNRLRTTHSTFLCYWPGAPHSGGNNIWYYTEGDDSDAKGFVPASAVNTQKDPMPGLVKCGD